MALAARTGGTATHAQRRGKLGARVFESWNQSKQQTRKERRGQREQHDRGVDGDLLESRQVSWFHKAQQTESAVRKG